MKTLFVFIKSFGTSRRSLDIKKLSLSRIGTKRVKTRWSYTDLKTLQLIFKPHFTRVYNNFHQASEAQLEALQTSKMKSFATSFNGNQPLIIVIKLSILCLCGSSGYHSSHVFFQNTLRISFTPVKWWSIFS